jgi:hypothetical protein
MKKTIFYTVIMATLVLMSCGNVINGPAIISKESMKSLLEEYNKTISPDAAIERIFLSYDDTKADWLSVRYNTDKSKIIQEKEYKAGVWYDLNSDTMNIEEGKPEDFLFSKNDFDLNRIPDLAEDAKARFKTEKNKEAIVSYATIELPTEVEDKKADLCYAIVLETEKQDINYEYVYDVNGKFKEAKEYSQE